MAASTVFSEQHLDIMIRCMFEPDENHERKSLHLSRILDFLGYSEKMINYRKQAYQEFDRATNTYITGTGFEVVTCGSKGEGLTKPFQSDKDVLHLDKRIICVEEGYSCQIPWSLTVLTYSPQYAHPGYTILGLGRHGVPPMTHVHQSIHGTDSGGQQVFSSDKYIAALAQKEPYGSREYSTPIRTGPAMSVRIGKSDIDHVYCIPSASPTVLYKWMTRPRQYDWPPEDLRFSLANLEGNFVAKGCKQSGMNKHEWRQCFNQIEILLLHSLKSTHRKLYALLKIVLKDIIRHFDRDKAITSYCMKNIVFWLAEMNPTSSFEPKYLMKWLIKALIMLRHSIASVSLPYYIIPARNLLADSMTEGRRKKLMHCLETLIRAGPRLLFKCKELNFSEKMTREVLQTFSEKRDDLETVYLSWFNHHSALEGLGLTQAQIDSDETHIAFLGRVTELTDSDWPAHVQDTLHYCTNTYERLAVILS